MSNGFDFLSQLIRSNTDLNLLYFIFKKGFLVATLIHLLLLIILIDLLNLFLDAMTKIILLFWGDAHYLNQHSTGLMWQIVVNKLIHQIIRECVFLPLL